MQESLLDHYGHIGLTFATFHKFSIFLHIVELIACSFSPFCGMFSSVWLLILANDCIKRKFSVLLFKMNLCHGDSEGFVFPQDSV